MGRKPNPAKEKKSAEMNRIYLEQWLAERKKRMVKYSKESKSRGKK